MKKQLCILIVCVIAGLSAADTFTHKKKDIVYHGYSTSQFSNGKNVVITQEKGSIELNLASYDIEYNHTGRNNFVSVLNISDVIAYDHATKAFEQAIVEEADKGPLLILIEIDTPGGRVDLCKRICAAISSARHSKTVAYINGGENGGAYSAGAAISLACDEIYLVPQVSIGAATMIAASADGKVADMKKAYGDTVGEKYDSAWRSYLASLAEENNRSGAIAKAMADKDIVVIEVARDEQRFFIEPQDKHSGDKVIRTVCDKGELLTLSAQEAVACNIAAGITESRQTLLVDSGIANADVIENVKQAEAEEEFEKVLRKFEKLNERLDLKFKELISKSRRNALTRSSAMRDYDAIIRSGQYLLKLKRSYPDIPYTEESLIGFVNDVKAEYAAIKAMR